MSESARTAPVISSTFDILKTLREKVENLPKSVPTAKKTGPLAGYCRNPMELTKDVALDADIWEIWDPRLNVLISHSISEIRPLVTQGKYGLIGLVQFLEHLVRDRQVNEGLLEGKVGRVIEAIDRHCSFTLCRSFLLMNLAILVSASSKSEMFPKKPSLLPPIERHHCPESSPSRTPDCHCHLTRKTFLPLPPYCRHHLKTSLALLLWEHRRNPKPSESLLLSLLSERHCHPNLSRSDSRKNCLCRRMFLRLLSRYLRHSISPSQRTLLERLQKEGDGHGLLQRSYRLSKF